MLVPTRVRVCTFYTSLPSSSCSSYCCIMKNSATFIVKKINIKVRRERTRGREMEQLNFIATFLPLPLPRRLQLTHAICLNLFPTPFLLLLLQLRNKFVRLLTVYHSLQVSVVSLSNSYLALLFHSVCCFNVKLEFKIGLF